MASTTPLRRLQTFRPGPSPHDDARPDSNDPTFTRPPTTSYRFGDYLLDTRPVRLLHAGRTVPLQPQPARLLELLLRRGGRIVSREQLKQHIWGDETFLDRDQGINFAISKIRLALDDDAAAPRYVETIPRVGYRFLAPVERVAAAGAASATTDGAPGRSDPAIDSADLVAPSLAAPADEEAAHSAAAAVESPEPGGREPVATRLDSTRLDAARLDSTRLDGLEAPRAVAPLKLVASGLETLRAVPDGSSATAAGRRVKGRAISRVVAACGALAAALAVTWVLARPDARLAPPPHAESALLRVAPLDVDPTQDDAATALTLGVHERLTRALATQLAGSPTVLSAASARVDEAAGLADYVLRGELERFGDRLQATLRLEAVHAPTLLWAGTFDVGLAELPAWYAEVGRHVGSALGADPPPTMATTATESTTHALSPEHTAELLEAYGSLWLDDEAAARGLRTLEALIAEAPDHAPLHAAIAEGTLRVVRGATRPRLEAMESAARRALELDAEQAAPHLVLAEVARVLHRDWATAEREADRAAELAPRWHRPLLTRAELSIARGRHEAAARDLEAAWRIDPLGAATRRVALSAAYHAGRWDETIALADDTIALHPAHGPAHELRIRALLAAGRPDEALRWLDTGFTRGGQPAAQTLSEALERVRASWDAAADAGHPVAVDQAIWAAYSGRSGEARTFLEQACTDQPSAALGFAGVEPAFAPLRRLRSWRSLANCLPAPAAADLRPRPVLRAMSSGDATEAPSRPSSEAPAATNPT